MSVPLGVLIGASIMTFVRSEKLIIFSTNSEINSEFYSKLEPFIQRSFVIKYDSEKGKTKKYDSYFFDEKGEKIIEV